MHLRDEDGQAGLRAGLREWLAATVATLPPRCHGERLTERREFDLQWQRRLFDAGYAGIDWPAQFGGRGETAAEQLVFLEECARAGAPGVGVNLVGLMHAGPTLIAMGGEHVQRQLLPEILRGEKVWCQGFSEPGAGSDLAAIRTAAVRDGDDYVITGQKIWSTNAQVADWCEMVVRTDSHSVGNAGLSWLAAPMTSPGIDVRPIHTIDGKADFCEVFLDEVRCPMANRVGEEGQGWGVAMATLTHERLLALNGDLIDATAIANQLADLLGKDDHSSLAHDLGVVKAEIAAVWSLLRRNVSAAAYGEPPRFAVSILKLALSELANRLGDIMVEFATCNPPVVDHALATELLDRRMWFFALSIAGGTSQIQRNIIAERLLGLPRTAR